MCNFVKVNLSSLKIAIKIGGLLTIQILLHCCFEQNLQAQIPTRIGHVTIDQGLSNNTVRSIFQDKRGFMWFGTNSGINRYDGNLVKVFRNKLSDSTSLPYNYVYGADEDDSQNVWVATGQGIGIYNRVHETFSSAYYHKKGTNEPIKLKSAIQVVKNDGRGNMLVGSNYQGLFTKKKSSKFLMRIPFKDNSGKLIYDLHIAVIAKAHNDQILIVAGGAGLCILDKNFRFFSAIPDQVKDINALNFNNRRLWAGTRSGLFVYDFVNGKYIPGKSPSLKAFVGKSITSLLIDHKNLWASLEGGALSVVNIENGVEDKSIDLLGNSAIGSREALYLFKDRDNRKWIGSNKMGVSFLDYNEYPFKSVTKLDRNSGEAEQTLVSSLAEMDNQRLWVGTEGSGLFLLDRNTQQLINYRHISAEPTSISDDDITSVLRDYKGVLWVTTYGGGVNRFESTSGSFRRYRLMSPGIPESKYAYSLMEDSRKNLWVTNFVNGGLYRYNSNLDKFLLFDRQLTNINTIKETSDRFLWAGNSNSLIKIKPESGQSKTYQIDKPVRAIHEDRDKNLWLGTEGGGLLLFDRNAGKIVKKFSEEDGLCNNAVLNILEDDFGNLWLSTFFGLSKFDRKKKFQNYYKNDGLSSNQFSYNAALKLKNGELAFGSIDGFTIFNPANLIHSKYQQPIPYLASLRLSANQTDPLPIKGDGYPILRIPYSKNSVSFSMSAIDLSRSGSRRILYILKGWDKGWNSAKSSTTVNYNRLEPGTYKLYAKSLSRLGVPGSATLILEIIIFPPWYRTIWSYFIYLIVIIIIIYQYRTYRVRKSDNKLKSILRRQAAEQEKELDKRKLRFFTEISHELRTPLTLIINPLQEYLRRNSSLAQLDELKRIHANALKLLSLVDQLLLFRKLGTVPDKLHIQKLDLGHVFSEIFISFADQAKIKRLNYTLKNELDKVDIYADKDKLSVIFNNLIANAIKFTPPRGNVSVLLEEDTQSVRVTVRDTGTGIPKSIGDKLFEQFYQVAEDAAQGQIGFGIGLYLVKHFVDAHNMSITYESVLGAGTSFYISIKKGFAHLRDYCSEENVHEIPNPARLYPVSAKPVKTVFDEIINKQKSILVVEDNQELLEFLTGILQERYYIHTSTSGNEGFESAKANLPDIIISDIMMDNGNGLELCSRIKNDSQLGHIPVILLTAVADDQIRLSGIECGADDYITKPFQSDLLLARIKVLLEHRIKLQDYFYNEITLKKHDFNIPPEYKEFLDKCILIINNHLSDEDFSIKKLSSEIGMSHSALYRKVKLISGQSIAKFIRYIRLRRAAELMIGTDFTINEIAFQVGLSDQKYFRMKFNALFGLNPSEYIKKYRPNSKKN
ncbi:two-component regulator propeller domain-containing protein [Pedobacter agri]|uniref:two-component regulator propeller domain-containing protein n=1 Tax=Pedobacter agri TaxID=454586 RepID=UPI00292ED445|nr:two-component regulator propeller domain-containing protein [Pedobacter agri]